MTEEELDALEFWVAKDPPIFTVDDVRDLVAEVRRLNKLLDHFRLAVDAWEDTYEALKSRCEGDESSVGTTRS